MPDAKTLIVVADLHGFFREEVVASRRQTRVHLSDAAEYYLVELLVAFSQRSSVADMYQDEPLLVLHQKAREAPLSQQITIFKQLADWALYVAGFFVEFIEKSLVTVDYYTAMGTAAYRNVAALCVSGNKPQAAQAVYTELADKFAATVVVLTQICHRSRQCNNSSIDLLKLYDRYVRTQNDRARKILEGTGIDVSCLQKARL